MEKMTINGETLGASQQNSLAVEQLLSDNDQVERIQQLNVDYTNEKDMAFNHTERGHVKFYEVVPLKAA